jgi:magnesium-transporting ATPase (P-type)
VAAQFTHLLALLLWCAAGLALLAGMPTLAIAIVVIIILNGLFAFWQEHRADRSTQRLRASSSPQAPTRSWPGSLHWPVRQIDRRAL